MVRRARGDASRAVGGSVARCGPGWAQGVQPSVVPGVVGLLLSAAVAGAQPPEGRIPVGSRLSLTPAVVFVTGHDTNLTRTTEANPGYEYYIVPQVEGWLGRGRTRMNFASAVEYQYNDTFDSGIWNNFNFAQLDAGAGRVTFQVIASRRDHYAPPSDFTGFELGLKSRRVESVLDGNVLIGTGGRWVFGVQSRNRRLRYDADQQYQDVSLQDNLNRDTIGLGGSAAAAITTLTSILTTVEFTRERFLHAPERDGNGLRVVSGLQFQPLALLTGRGQIGYLQYNTSATGDSYGGPTFDLGVRYDRGGALLDVSGGRMVDFSFDPSSGFYVTTGLDAYGSVRLARAWEVFGRWSRRHLSPQGPIAEEEPFRGIGFYKLGAAYRFGRYTRLGTDFERYTHGGPGGFEGRRFTVFLIYGSDRIQRLDRPLPGGF
jgi:hypothetical protein